jgi:glycerol-3-phosphate dehydrogenase
MSSRGCDLLVIGGGIAGAFVAWDAALRGLSVALVERRDFGAATSSASSKIIHSGIRYLQRFGFGRVLESLREQAIFLRIAPHLVHPVPFLVPSYGYGWRGKPFLAAGMSMFRLLALGQPRAPDPGQRLSSPRLLSREEMLALEPGLPSEGLTGGAVYHEGQMHSSERTTLAVILAAAGAGARIANYAPVIGFVKKGNTVQGVRVVDALGGGEIEIRARVVVNASGPWAREVLASLAGKADENRMSLSKGVHILTRPVTRGHAVAFSTGQRSEALVVRGGRHIFIIPWRGHSLIGTTNVPYSGSPDDLAVAERDVRDFLAEINTVYPAARLSVNDVVFSYAGLYPLEGKTVRAGVYQGGDRSLVMDHRKDGIEGLITVISVKYTTSRSLAQEVVDLVFRKLQRDPPPCLTSARAVHGGEIDRRDDFLAAAIRGRPPGIGEDAVRELFFNHGTAYADVLRHVNDDPRLGEPVSPGRPTLAAEVLHGVREEMAATLSDVIFRRTGLGSLGHPGEEPLRTCAGIMAGELGWGGRRIQQELDSVRAAFAPMRE